MKSTPGSMLAPAVAMAERRHSLDTVRRALTYVSPDCDREQWVRMLAAVKSELGDEGRELAQKWSARGATYKAAAFRSAWTSLRPDGGVTVGTLLAVAKEGGFSLVDATPAVGTPAPATDRAARERAEEAHRLRRRDAAATEAQRRFAAASDDRSSPYLERKRVRPYGVRVEADGMLLVPMYNAAGELRNVQAIAADGTKKFLPGGQASDLWHELGSDDDACLAVCEGYATAATIHEATGLRSVVAFNAGNLAGVVRLLRAKYPTALLILCADDDRATAQRSGKNPGLRAARDAARIGGAVVAIPAPLEGEETDFNDLGRRLGLPAVAAIIAAAQTALVSSSPAAPSAMDPFCGRGTGPFEVSERGVFHIATDRDGRASANFVCSPLTVLARTRDADGASWGYLTEHTDPEGTTKRIAIGARQFAGDGNELRARLLDEGLELAVGPAKNRLAHYIVSRRPARLVHCVDRVGWHGTTFVLPRKSYGEAADDVHYQPVEARVRDAFRTGGTIEAWRAEVAALCVGNARLVFAVAVAFAGPCAGLVDALGGGFHYYGASSKGKSTALAVGAGVWGRPEVGHMVRPCRATSNALEGGCAAHNDLAMFLDESRELDPREALPTVLMVGNGGGKARMSSSGAQRPAVSWRLLFLSTGERRLAELSALVGQSVDAGAGVRLVEIPVPEAGAFETLHGASDAAAFAETIRTAALRQYGTAGDAWLEWLVGHRAEAAAFLSECMRELLDAWLQRRNDSGQTQRVASRFALVAAAGELATRAGITGWQAGESERAAKRLFDDWIAARGTRGDAEALAALRQVAGLLSQHAESYFPWWHRGADDHRPNAPKRWGLRRMVDSVGNEIETHKDHLAIVGETMSPKQGEGIEAKFFILTSAWREEVCRGFDPKYVAGVLQRRGHLIAENDKPGARLDRKERLPGIGPARCFVIKPGIFEDPDL